MRTILTLCAVLVACSESTHPAVSARGRYALVSVSGQPLPLTTSAFSGFNATLKSGVIEMNESFWFGEYVHQYQGQAQEFKTSIVGQSYIVNGSTVTLVSLQGVTWHGVLSGNTLTVTHANYVSVYQR